MNAVFAVKPGVYDQIMDDTLVCRCEEVTAGEIRADAPEGSDRFGADEGDDVSTPTAAEHRRSGFRLIRQTVREKLPEGFQRAEFLLDHGAIDMIVHRRDMKTRISALIGKLLPDSRVREGQLLMRGGMGRIR